MKSSALLKQENKKTHALTPLFKMYTEALTTSADENYKGLYQGVEHNFGKISVHNVNKLPPHLIKSQPKLMINQPGDAYEQEADAMAEKVMGMPDSSFIHPKHTREEEGEKVGHKPLVSFIQRKNDSENLVISEGVSSKICSTQRGGNPLIGTTKSFMESRFGTDFSNVRIHTGPYAVQMSKNLNAQAFTLGRDIYFNEGKFEPESQQGKHLLAHELTHTVQQGSSNVVKRRELFGRSRFGRIFRGNQTDRPEDWWNIDRLDWPNYRANPQANSFIRAVIYNTEHNNVNEYATASERHDYYRVVDMLIQTGFMSPRVQGVRFFEAAGMTTGAVGVAGAVGSIGGRLTHSADTRQVLLDVNRILLDANMAVIGRLISRRQPTDPNNPSSTTSVSTLLFDLGMVDMEQNRVEQYLTTHAHAITSTVISEINADLNSGGFFRTIAPIRPFQFQWARNVLNTSTLDFTIQRHRVAIGKALVFLLHGHSEQQYQNYMNNNILP